MAHGAFALGVWVAIHLLGKEHCALYRCTLNQESQHSSRASFSILQLVGPPRQNNVPVEFFREMVQELTVDLPGERPRTFVGWLGKHMQGRLTPEASKRGLWLMASVDDTNEYQLSRLH